MKERIQLHEWFFLIAIFGIILSLSLFSYFSSQNTSHLLDSEKFFIQESEKITIDIQGEVEKPGLYNVVKGSYLIEGVLRSKPKRFANIDEISKDKKIFESMTVKIGILEFVSIELKGAVKKPGKFLLPIKTRLSDLAKMDIFLSDANLLSLKSRRYLKNHEVVVVSCGGVVK